MNNDGSKSILCERNKVEVALINQSLMYFRKAMKTKAYQDKIYTQLKKNQVWDRIINCQLRRDECDSEDVYNFLSLLQRNNGIINQNEYQPIIETE